MIIGKSFKNIKFEDIDRLVNNRVCESRYLDYKRKINLEKGDDRKEFLFDICSFANSEGGVIIYGVSEQLDENNRNIRFEK